MTQITPEQLESFKAEAIGLCDKLNAIVVKTMKLPGCVDRPTTIEFSPVANGQCVCTLFAAQEFSSVITRVNEIGVDNSKINGIMLTVTQYQRLVDRIHSELSYSISFMNKLDLFKLPTKFSTLRRLGCQPHVFRMIASTAKLGLMYDELVVLKANLEAIMNSISHLALRIQNAQRPRPTTSADAFGGTVGIGVSNYYIRNLSTVSGSVG